MAVEMAAEPKRVGQQLKVASKKGFPLALVIGSAVILRKTRQGDRSVFAAPGRQFFLSFSPPVAAGGLLSWVLYQQGAWAVLPGTWLLSASRLGGGASPK